MALTLNNIQKRYGERAVLEDIRLRIEDGEFLALLGASGCGKSTLLNIIAGLDAPTEGQVLLDGAPVTGPGPDRGYIFQDAALFPWLSVLENVEFGLRVGGLPKAQRLEKALHYLGMVNLADYRDYRVHELSGGMKQRVSLARALSMDSRVLLMDEPFAALDSHTKAEMRAHLLDIWRETGKTIVFVTHSLQEAFTLADRVVVLSAGPARIQQEYRPRGDQNGDLQRMMEEARALLAPGENSIAC